MLLFLEQFSLITYLMVTKSEVESHDVNAGVEHLTHVFRVVSGWTQ